MLYLKVVNLTVVAAEPSNRICQRPVHIVDAHLNKLKKADYLWSLKLKFHWGKKGRWLCPCFWNLPYLENYFPPLECDYVDRHPPASQFELLGLEGLEGETGSPSLDLLETSWCSQPSRCPVRCAARTRPWSQGPALQSCPSSHFHWSQNQNCLRSFEAFPLLTIVAEKSPPICAARVQPSSAQQTDSEKKYFVKIHPFAERDGLW